MTNQEFLDRLNELGLLEYGAKIPVDLVRELLGLEFPKVGTKALFDALSLKEIAAVDYVRNTLLGRGKYLGKVKEHYVVFLPSQNAKQVESYMTSADKKLRRALKLSRNTPGGAGEITDNQTRIIMKQDVLKRERAHNKLNK
jgi:hypothetical protein